MGNKLGKYSKLIEDLRKIYTESGSDLFDKATDWSMNEFYQTKDGSVELVFDYGGLNEMRTPEGSHPVLGSRVVGNDDKAFKAIMDKYRLVEVKPQLPDSECHYRASGPTYRITKGV